MKQFILLKHAIALGLVTIIFLVIYGTVQQNYRTGLDDPQLQLVENAKAQLLAGKAYTALLPADTIDIGNSLSTFLAFYDKNGDPLASNGFLDKGLPHLPKGVFEATREKGSHRLSWQPRRGIRQALVIAEVTSGPVGFVASGRAMREVEQRISSMSVMILVGWLLCAGLLAISLLLHFIQFNKTKTGSI